MSNSETPGLHNALKRWKTKQLPTKFKEFKITKTLPQYEIKATPKFQGRLFRVVPGLSPVYDLFCDETTKLVCLHFFRNDLARFGTYRKKVPVGEIVLSTGKVGDFKIKSERAQYNAIEVLTTVGVGYIFWKNLEEIKNQDK